eukprot:PhF_6_TR22262/c0_g1_i1/m.31464
MYYSFRSAHPVIVSLFVATACLFPLSTDAQRNIYVNHQNTFLAVVAPVTTEVYRTITVQINAGRLWSDELRFTPMTGYTARWDNDTNVMQVRTLIDQDATTIVSVLNTIGFYTRQYDQSTRQIWYQIIPEYGGVDIITGVQDVMYEEFHIRSKKFYYVFPLVTEPVTTDVFSGFTMVLQKGRTTGDVLQIAGGNPTGYSVTYTPSNGLLTVKSTGGTRTAKEITAIVRRVVFYTSSYSRTARMIDFSFMVGGSLTIFYSVNGHFYENVAAPGMTWYVANTSCAARRLQGKSGYLTTLTSKDEYDFFYQIVNGQGWLGGSDEETRTKKEGSWEWVTGPEQYTLFYQWTGVGGQWNGTCFTFCSWSSGEPNNWGGREGFLHAYGSGYWNDYNFNNGAIQAYFCEY